MLKRNIESDPDYVRRAFHASLDQFLARDFTLIALDASEWAISHRLAVYLESWFSTFDVDCEYNRLEFEVKNNSDGSWFRPDIIVHDRTVKHSNLLIIDVKCTTNNEGAKASQDFHDLTQESDTTFKYSFGVFVRFHTQKKELLNPDQPRISGFWRDYAQNDQSFELKSTLSAWQDEQVRKRKTR